jgi:hypothetical protein
MVDTTMTKTSSPICRSLTKLGVQTTQRRPQESQLCMGAIDARGDLQVDGFVECDRVDDSQAGEKIVGGFRQQRPFEPADESGHFRVPPMKYAVPLPIDNIFNMSHGSPLVIELFPDVVPLNRKCHTMKTH